VKVRFHPAADAELRGAARYYEDRVPGLGGEFVAEVERVCARSATNSDQGSMPSIVELPSDGFLLG